MSASWRSTRRLAALGVGAQLLALIRTLGEVFRIKYFVSDQYTLAAIEPFVGAAFFTAVLAAAAVVAFALGRHRAVVGIAVMNILALFIYKLFL
jgi:hypothetical protein